MTENKEGTKTIKLGVYFWTNLGSKNVQDGVKMPKKTCWDKGFVSVVSNNWHGIRSGTYRNFNNLGELTDAIKDVLTRSGIQLIDNAKDKEYKEALRRIKAAAINDVSQVLLRTAELRTGKSVEEMSQSEGMKQAWKELKESKKRNQPSI